MTPGLTIDDEVRQLLSTAALIEALRIYQRERPDCMVCRRRAGTPAEMSLVAYVSSTQLHVRFAHAACAPSEVRRCERIPRPSAWNMLEFITGSCQDDLFVVFKHLVNLAVGVGEVGGPLLADYMQYGFQRTEGGLPQVMSSARELKPLSLRRRRPGRDVELLKSGRGCIERFGGMAVHEQWETLALARGVVVVLAPRADLTDLASVEAMTADGAAVAARLTYR